MSKGSKPRPYSVSKEVFDNNWNAIFKNKNKDESHHKESDNKIVLLLFHRIKIQR